VRTASRVVAPTLIMLHTSGARGIRRVPAHFYARPRDPELKRKTRRKRRVCISGSVEEAISLATESFPDLTGFRKPILATGDLCP